MTIYQICQLESRNVVPIAYCATLDIAKEFIIANLPTDSMDIKRGNSWFTAKTLDKITEDNVQEFEIMEFRKGGYHFHIYTICPLAIIDK